MCNKFLISYEQTSLKCSYEGELLASTCHRILLSAKAKLTEMQQVTLFALMTGLDLDPPFPSDQFRSLQSVD